MTPIIRDAEKRDLPRLLELYGQLAEGGQLTAAEAKVEPDLARYEAAFEAVSADPRQRLLMLEEEGRVVGTLVLLIVPQVTNRGLPWANVESVVIDESLRGGGHGRMLMDHAERLAREAGCYKLNLTSNNRRADTAHRFYEALGYESTHRAFRKNL